MQPPGLRVPTNLPTEYVSWRIKVRRLRDVLFDDEKKAVFLGELHRTGKLSLACERAGVLYATYRKARQDDEDFDQACEHTKLVHDDTVVYRIEQAALQGNKEPIFGANGELGERVRFESGIRAMVLKAHDPERYGDKQQIDVNVQHGAVVVPAILSPDDWEAQFVENQAKFEAITTTGEEAAKQHAALPPGDP